MKLLATAFLTLFSCTLLQAQTADAEVTRYLGLIRDGQVEVVKSDIPTLLGKYPNHPGVLFLQGVTATDGAEAARIYQSIVDNFPKSEWADDALFKLYQFYQSLGLYRTAEMKMAQLRKDYPSSTLGRGDTLSVKLPDEPVQQAVDTAATSAAAPQFSLQVGAYTTAANAEKQKSVFQDLAYPVEVITKVKDGRSLYIVLVGTFATADEARTVGAEIKKQRNVDALVTAR
jgi:hypothetical protein